MAKPILIIRHFNEEELKQLRKVLIESGVGEQYFIITFVCSDIPNDYKEYPKFEVHGSVNTGLLSGNDVVDLLNRDVTRTGGVINDICNHNFKESGNIIQNLNRKAAGLDPL